MRDPKASDFCYYPFMQILLTSDGKYRPCSKHQDYVTNDGRELSVQNGDTLEDAWTSDYMQNIRQQFLENKQFEGCRECWRMQDMGLRSMRYDSYQYGTSEQQVTEPLRPTRIEINASNVCNLKCRICYPNASSKWIKEHGDLYGSNEKIYYNLSLPNLEQVKQWGDSLEEVCFFGGEPLLSQENMELLDHFISTGNAGRMSILFNTNGTVFNDEITDRLRHFKLVRMYFSVDDIGQRFEYQRKGAKWDEVADNIGKAYRLSRSPEGQNIDFKICCTVSIFNIYYFPEFFDWFETNYPGLRVFWNLLFDPWRLNVQILPKPVKALITERLRKHVKSTYTRSEQETKTIEELVTFLNEDVQKPFDEFLRYVNRHDTFRQESYPTVFPEFYELIKDNEPEDLDWNLARFAEITKRALKESSSPDDLSGILSKNLDNNEPFEYNQSLALNLLRYHRTTLHSNLNFVPALFSTVSGTPSEEANQRLAEAVFSQITKASASRRGAFCAQNVELLRVCCGYSDKLLYSLACVDQKSLIDGINGLTVAELASRLDDDHRVFTAQAQKLLSGEADWEHSTVFKDVANSCFSNKEIEARLELGRKWSELFIDDSKHIVQLLYAVLNLTPDQALSENQMASASEKLTGWLTSVLTETKQAKEDPVFLQKISVLRICALNSESLLCSLVLTEKEELAKDLCELRPVDLVLHIEKEHSLFSSVATQLISEKTQWEFCSIFREVADVCFPELDDSGRWDLCENWSVHFRDSKHVINLYCIVLKLPSTAALLDVFIATLSNMPDDDSSEYDLKKNIKILEDVLTSVVGEKALVDFLQTGRTRLHASLKCTTKELLTTIEARYGALVL